MSLIFLLAFLVVFVPILGRGAGVNDSAWNGHLTPGATVPSAFTPYYVPPGAKSYDSSSPLLHYSGKWMDSYSSAYVQNTLRWTSHVNASVSFTFIGTGIEWFGNTGPSHGMTDVYIDGRYIESATAYDTVRRKGQRIFWKFDLSYGKHTVKIINTGRPEISRNGRITDLDAFVVTKGVATLPASDPPNTSAQNFASDMLPMNLAGSNPSSQWSLVQRGSTGVNAMQLAIISPTHALIVDKVEHNPLTISGHPAWAALYDLQTDAVIPLAVQSNSFCAGGTFLRNGTLINVGGNPVVEDHTSSADFGDLDGLQAIRIFEPCLSSSPTDCPLYEDHSRIRMASPRWYNTVLRISDGSAMIIGGSKKGGWINNATVNNPTIEYWPPKSIHGSNGLPIQLSFLATTLNSNLFPIAFALPDGRIFMAANTDAIIYDWENNTEENLPAIPNGVRVTYPMTGTALLLPLSPEDNYKPEILLCGGSTVDDSKPSYEITSQEPASAQCVRMVLDQAGIALGWQVEQMPQARMMPDAVLLPTGDILIVNGGQTGISGYGNVIEQVGASNADNPAFTPVLYNPSAPTGQRFSSEGMPSSQIPRLYHSVATLTPDGQIMIAGSNPNLDRSEIKYGTEYRVEWLSPPYMAMQRPTVEQVTQEEKLAFGQTMQLNVQLPQGMAHSQSIKVTLMDLGYVTHSVHANSRIVYLAYSLSPDSKTLTITGPPSGDVYPPGPGWLYVVVDGIPSTGIMVMVGDGASPPVDDNALENLLAKTAVDQYEKSKGEKTDNASE